MLDKQNVRNNQLNFKEKSFRLYDGSDNPILHSSNWFHEIQIAIHVIQNSFHASRNSFHAIKNSFHATWNAFHAIQNFLFFGPYFCYRYLLYFYQDWLASSTARTRSGDGNYSSIYYIPGV